MHDAELLDRWRSGDNRAGQTLFRRHFTMLYSYFRRRAPEAAPDLVQATLLACVERPDRFRGEAKFGTFLYAIARNQLVDHLRRRNTRERWTSRESERCDVGQTSLSSVVARKHRGQRVRLAMGQLDTGPARVLQMYECEGMSAPEIANVLGVPVGTIRSRIRRSRAALRRLLESDAVLG